MGRFLLLWSYGLTANLAGEVVSGTDGFATKVKPFFETYCVACHGPEKKKGQIAFHELKGAIELGDDPENWESILEVLESEEMPPEDERQPSGSDREAIKHWIDHELQNAVRKGSEIKPAPLVRRLTNFEYQNTMRDLLGFELDFVKNLPEDPKKPYHFNNTAEFMLLGPEQIDRYLENARRALASAIVDPREPKVIRQSQRWDLKREGKGGAEIPVYQGPGVGRQTMRLRDWPVTGEYRIRIKAAGRFPEGFDEVPLRLVLGTDLRHDSGTGEYEPVGTVFLRNHHDDLQEFEFRGRIENHPIQVGQITKKGLAPPSMTITAQNLFDNGELNDHRRSAFDSSWSELVPRVVLESIEFEAPVIDVWPPVHHQRILFDSPLRANDQRAYVAQVIERFVTRAFRRPALDSEVERFVRLYDLLAPGFDSLEETMRETLSMVLIAPQFLYHTVSGEGITSPQFELASRLSYFLWGSMPDEDLLKAASDGQLSDLEILTEQVRRLLEDERSRDFVENFTSQWLSLEKMKSVQINQNLFPRFLYYVHVGERRGQEILFRPTIRDYMYQETVGFVAELIRRNESARHLIDSDFAWLNEPLASHYGVEGVRGLQMRAVPIARKHRLGGLPTQGSILIGNSNGSAPHPIYRAVWLREAILGDTVKPPPAEVPALSDSAGESSQDVLSIKDLLIRHREVESCNDCHARLDPWGIAFEHYSAVGSFQPRIAKEGARVRGVNLKEDGDLKGYRAYLDRVFNHPVDATTRIPNGPEINGMSELKEYLIESRMDDVAENVIRRLMTYGLGRELTYRDREVVANLVTQSKTKNYGLREMIVSICLSDSFCENLPSHRE
jgi:hypothetical protein